MSKLVIGQAVRMDYDDKECSSQEGVVKSFKGEKVLVEIGRNPYDQQWVSERFLTPCQGDGCFTCEKCGLPLNGEDECSGGCKIEWYNKIPLGR